jgi:uncharacterized protein (DUF2147 family)
MKALFFTIGVVCLPVAAIAAPLEISGLWRTARHDALVEITDCGDGAPCGVLVWIDPETSDSTYDRRNPEPALRERPLLGAPILWGFEPSTDNRWTKGRLYNPEDGKTFRAKLKLMSDGRLRVKGCFGPLCRARIWTRASIAAVESRN